MMGLRKHLPCLLFASILAPAPATASSPLASNLARVIEEEQLPGVVWSLVSDESIESGAVGVADTSTRKPLTLDNRVHVGSIAKAVLATGILRLASQDLLELDAPVARYLPTLAVHNPFGDAPITVRHLLDHTAGIEDSRLWHVFSTRSGPTDPLANAFRGASLPLDVRTRPGERMSYSNLGYTVLGMLIQSVSGQDYEAWMDAQVLAPLGMHDSTFRFTTQEGPNADPTLAWGHLDDGTRHAAVAIAVRPAAQLTTTAGDLARFAVFTMGDGSIGGAAFIRLELMRERGRPTRTEAAQGGLEVGISLGLARRDRHGAVGNCHGGSIVGFNAIVCAFPESRKAFAIVANGDREGARYDRLHAALIAHLAPAAVAPPVVARPTADPAKWEGTYVAAPSRFEAFAYLDAIGDAVTVSRSDAGLELRRLLGSPTPLAAVDGPLFKAPGRLLASHVFIEDRGGRHRFSTGTSTYERAPAFYVPALRASLVLGCAGLLWFLGVGMAGLIRGKGSGMTMRDWAPVAGVLALALPAPFFLAQSFVNLGDVTAASVLLALVTAALPFAMIAPLSRARRGRLASMNALAALAVLQWCAVLAWWGLMPTRLWH